MPSSSTECHEHHDHAHHSLTAGPTLLSPVVAAAAMALSSVSVIGNVLRLRTVKVD
jgi:cation transport ATPase